MKALLALFLATLLLFGCVTSQKKSVEKPVQKTETKQQIEPLDISEDDLVIDDFYIELSDDFSDIESP